MDKSEEICRFAAEHKKEAQELLATLAQIPAPSGNEGKRAQFCKDWLVSQGAVDTYIDAACNVIYPVGDVKNGDLIVIAAHSDVVFSDTTELPLTVQNGRMCAPGIGDDTANVAALLMTAKYITQKALFPKNGGVLFVIDSCEEGLGNLKGIRRIMSDFGERVREFISFDCHADELIESAVGSKRYLLTATTKGGHSYFDFGNDNAIAVLCRFVSELYAVLPSQENNVTYNVGEIGGGTSVNTIAQEAHLLFEYRSETASGLAYMDRQVETILEHCRKDGVTLALTEIGNRPCGGTIDEDKQQALVERAYDTIYKYFGSYPVKKSGSTDCNIPLSMGIPSVCFGCILGGGMHTREEYIEADSIESGLMTAIDTVLYYF